MARQFGGGNSDRWTVRLGIITRVQTYAYAPNIVFILMGTWLKIHL